MTTVDSQLEALEAAATGLLVLDRNWRIVWANNAVATMAAVPADRWRGARVWDVLPRLRGHAETRAVRRTRTDGEPRSFRIEYRDEQVGGVFDVRVARASNGYLLLEVHDVSALLSPERADSEVVVETQLLRALARAVAEARTSDAMLQALGDLTLQATGASAIIVTAVEGDQAVVLHSEGAGLPPRGSSVSLAGTLTERITNERTVFRSDTYDVPHPLLQELVREAGIGELLGAPLLAYDEVVGVIGVSRNRGAEPFDHGDEYRLRLLADHAALPLWRARLLEQAQAANLAKTNFLATMSHELRTPLTALTGYGELLADGILGELGANQMDAVERMRAVTHHLTVLIDEILAFSNLEAGRERVHHSCVDARSIANQVTAVAEPLAHQKHIEFVVDLPAEELKLISDADKIRQILVNLTGNAVKFTDEGRVTLSARREDKGVRFKVNDTGPGISNSDLERLFQPFGQLDTGLTRRHGGTGLGLYISSRLAELLGGRIDVSSRIASGSTFELFVPSYDTATV